MHALTGVDAMNETVTQQFGFSKVTQPAKVFQQTSQLMGAFWLLTIVLIVWHVYALIDNEFTDVLGSAFISAAALLPAYYWCAGKLSGMPIFPLYTITFLWTYAAPLLGGQTKITIYDADERFFASMIVSAFLFLGTAVWYRFAKTTTRPPEVCLAMTAGKGDRFLILALFISVLFTIALVGGWLTVAGGIFSLIRGGVMGLHALAVFVLSYRWGRRQLTRTSTILVLMLLVMNGLANASSLLLIGSMTTFVLALVSFSIGRQQIPWKTLLTVVLCFALLHPGKGEMRKHYWWSANQTTIQPWNYPALYAEWIGYSLKNLTNPAGQGGNQSLLNRSSLIHVFLMVQRQSPDIIPYLNGATYAIIPQLFIPRIFNTQKIASHEGTYLLNIHYGLQSRVDTRTTTLAWGMLNEAYANFGLAGVAGLAIVIGALYGKVTSWSRQMPILSLRTFVALLFLSLSIQVEVPAGFYVAALFQSLMVLGVVAFVFMQRQSISDADKVG